MIYECLSCLAAEMNIFFRSKLKINEDKVIVSGLVNQDGTVAIPGENKLIITLLNLEREINIRKETMLNAGALGNTTRPMTVQLNIMVSCYFSANNYSESLKFLSLIIGFLQDKNVFTHANTPTLDDSIEKFVLEMDFFDFDRLNNIWATLGAKYMPSVFYKVRLITFDSSTVREIRPTISGVAEESGVTQESLP